MIPYLLIILIVGVAVGEYAHLSSEISPLGMYIPSGICSGFSDHSMMVECNEDNVTFLLYRDKDCEHNIQEDVIHCVLEKEKKCACLDEIPPGHHTEFFVEDHCSQYLGTILSDPDTCVPISLPYVKDSLRVNMTDEVFHYLLYPNLHCDGEPITSSSATLNHCVYDYTIKMGIKGWIKTEEENVKEMDEMIAKGFEPCVEGKRMDEDKRMWEDKNEYEDLDIIDPLYEKLPPETSDAEKKGNLFFDIILSWF